MNGAGAPPVIRARGLTKRFGNLVAVNELDLRVSRGEVYGFLGPNGSGKSTTIRMLCGLLLPTGGDIEVLGYRIPRDAEALKRRIGSLPKNSPCTRTSRLARTSCSWPPSMTCHGPAHTGASTSCSGATGSGNSATSWRGP